MSETRKEISCGAVVIRVLDGKLQVLVIRQKQGHWCFPKGHVEGSETEHETAAREIKEETGLDVRFLDGFRECTYYSPAPGVEKKVVYFLAEMAGGKEKIQEEELLEMHWASLLDTEALLSYANDVELFRKAIAFLHKEDPDGVKWPLR
ncbi:MAG: NUDIX domain-containing protein [Lactimicrobium sp.]|jgi:bis(5'-nucleosidyl)-tetraphosphatase|uniref:bis(5'-nucleosyl)-tetraphosphatase n=1 Tax=Lactimicrobium sp. TaxID=2563780 RepID=UPI002F35FE6C